MDEVLAKVQSAEEHPSVLWYTHSSSAPHFNVRTDADYVNSIVSAAGGRLLFPQSAQDNSIKLSNEDFLLLMNEADKIVMGVSLNSYRDAKDMTYFNKEGQVDFSKAPAFANRDCYVVGYDWRRIPPMQRKLSGRWLHVCTRICLPMKRPRTKTKSSLFGLNRI